MLKLDKGAISKTIEIFFLKIFEDVCIIINAVLNTLSGTLFSVPILSKESSLV